MSKNISAEGIDRMQGKRDKEYGDNILKVTTLTGAPLNYTIRKQ